MSILHFDQRKYLILTPQGFSVSSEQNEPVFPFSK